MILAGDVGGTKTLLGLFERAQPRPSQRHLFRYSTTDFSTFAEQLDAFARDKIRITTDCPCTLGSTLTRRS